MSHPGGYARIDHPDGAAIEFDTFTCAHCNRVTHVAARQRPEDIGGLCKQCMGLICPGCVGAPCVAPGCGPVVAWEQKNVPDQHGRAHD